MSGPRPLHWTRRGPVYAIRLTLPIDLRLSTGASDIRRNSNDSIGPSSFQSPRTGSPFGCQISEPQPMQANLAMTKLEHGYAKSASRAPKD